MANKSLRYKMFNRSLKGLVKEVERVDEFIHHELAKSLDEAEDVLTKLGYTDLVRKRVAEDDNDDIIECLLGEDK